MHDPMTVAFEIKYPWKTGSKAFRYHPTAITIWHVDPERDGSDDSCGWFMRSRHGDPNVLNRIVKRFEFDWDRVFISENSAHTYNCGFFKKDGQPHFSVIGVTLNLFFLAVCEHFKSDGHSNWKKARRWMSRNLFDLILFAENPTDSLHECLTRKFAEGCSEPYDKRRRDERLKTLAHIVYGWILRHERPWWREPRWHIHHWKIQVHALGEFKRWAFSRCCKCGKGFSWGYAPVTNSWDGTGPRWFRSEEGVFHSDCDRPKSECSAAKASV